MALLPLPPNSTLLEQDLVEVGDFVTRLNTGLQTLPGVKFRSPHPTDLLPYLLLEWGLGEISSYVSNQEQLISEGIDWQRVRGTFDAIEKGLSWVGYSSILEEAPTRRLRWHLFMLMMGRVRDVEEPDLARIEGIVGLSVPVRSHFWRGFFGYDIRPLEYGYNKASETLVEAYSGARIREGGAVWSYGRRYEASLALTQANLEALGVWVAPSSLAYTWSSLTSSWESADFPWSTATNDTRVRLMLAGLEEKSCWIEFKNAANVILGYRRAKINSLVNPVTDGPVTIAGQDYAYETDFIFENILPVNLQASRVVMFDLIRGIKRSRPSVTTPFMDTNITSVTSTGGNSIDQYKNIKVNPANTLRVVHDLTGKPLGALFEGSHSYINKESPATYAQLALHSGGRDAVAPVGAATAIWTEPVTNGGLGWAYHTVAAYTPNTSYYWKAEVWTADGSVPVLGVGAGAHMCPNLGGEVSLAMKHPDTDVVNSAKVTGPFAGGVYHVEMYGNVAAWSGDRFGWIRYPANNLAMFKVGRMISGPGRYAPSFFDNDTATPNTRQADILTVSAPGFTFQDSVTLFAEFVWPSVNTASRMIVSVDDALTSTYIGVYISNSTNLTFYTKAPSTGFVQTTITGFVPGRTYRMAATFDAAGSLLKLIATGKTQTTAAISPAAYSAVPNKVYVGHQGGVYVADTAISFVAIGQGVHGEASVAEWVNAPALDVHQETLAKHLYVEGLTDFGDGYGLADAASAAIVFDAYPTDPLTPGLLWALPSEITVPISSVASRAVAIPFGRTVRERICTLLRIDV